MKRQIKFRAWDKYHKSFINGFNMIGFSTGQGAPERKLQRFSTYWNEEDIILMQYTGLTDKNGKEIYEGDLIEVKTEKYHFISEIVWNDTAGGFEFQDTQNTYCGLDAIKIFEHGHSLYGGFAEVIGNIYKNPELLKAAADEKNT